VEAERRFRAMGCDAHLMVVGGSETLADAAVERIDDLEGRWSRFRPDSEISLLNGLPNLPIEVSPETYDLITRAVYAWEVTGGAFDPTVLPSLLAYGYDRSYEHIDASPNAALPILAPAPGCSGIVTDPSSRSVVLPSGVTIDPGGIGKGLAADIVVAELLTAGAAGAMVSLGGDVRVAGRPPSGSVWSIAVDDPFDPEAELTRVQLTGGAVTTSSRLRRSWTRGGETVHHLIDPKSGASFGGDVATVTTVASEGWWAEAMTKVVFASGLGALVNAEAIVVTCDGQIRHSPGFGQVAA
jgi:thiamine biosynthesis lipoprotein